jgi:MFS family permease
MLLVLWTQFLLVAGTSIQEVTFALSLRELGFSTVYVGSHTATLALGLLSLAIPVGIAMSRVSIKHLLIAGIALQGLAFLLRAFAIDPGVRLTASFLAGAGASTHGVTLAILIYRLLPSDRLSRGYVNFALFGMAGGLVGNLLGGYLPKILASDPHQGFRLTLAVGALIVLSSTLLLRKIPSLTEAAEHIPMLALLKEWTKQKRIKFETRHRMPRIFVRVTPHLLTALGSAASVPFFPLLLASRYGADSADVGWIYSISQAGMFATVFLGPRIFQNWRAPRIVAAAQILSLPFLALTAFAPTLWGAAIGMVGRAMLINMGNPYVSQFLMESSRPKDRKLVQSMDVLVWNGAWSVMPQFAGALIASVNFKIALAITFTLHLSSSLLYLRLGRGKTPKTSS